MHDSNDILIRLTSNTNGRSTCLVYIELPYRSKREPSLNTGYESGFPERSFLNIELNWEFLRRSCNTNRLCWNVRFVSLLE